MLPVSVPPKEAPCPPRRPMFLSVSIVTPTRTTLLSVNPLGGHLGDREFPADPGGYRQPAGLGLLDRIGRRGGSGRHRNLRSPTGPGADQGAAWRWSRSTGPTAQGAVPTASLIPWMPTQQPEQQPPVGRQRSEVTRRHRGVRPLSSRCSAIGSQGKNRVHQPDSRAADQWPDGLA